MFTHCACASSSSLSRAKHQQPLATGGSCRVQNVRRLLFPALAQRQKLGIKLLGVTFCASAAHTHLLPPSFRHPRLTHHLLCSQPANTPLCSTSLGAKVQKKFKIQKTRPFAIAVSEGFNHTELPSAAHDTTVSALVTGHHHLPKLTGASVSLSHSVALSR